MHYARIFKLPLLPYYFLILPINLTWSVDQASSFVSPGLRCIYNDTIHNPPGFPPEQITEKYAAWKSQFPYLSSM